MKNEVSILLVDDHILFRDGLKYVLEQSGDLSIIGEASNGKEYLELLKHMKPDITLMDISMPEMDGIEATRKALEKYPELKIVALTMFDDEKYYYDILHAGAKGFVLKDSDSEDLIKAIKDIANGDSYFSSDVLIKVIRSYSSYSGNGKPGENETVEFSNKELKILKYICAGMTNKEISLELNLNQRTVEGIRNGLLTKTNSSNSLNLVLYAIENKLIENNE